MGPWLIRMDFSSSRSNSTSVLFRCLAIKMNRTPKHYRIILLLHAVILTAIVWEWLEFPPFIFLLTNGTAVAELGMWVVDTGWDLTAKHSCETQTYI